eukprot:6152090-Alexandrium_andersonii.AAC.1
MGVWVRRQLRLIPRSVPTTFLGDCSLAAGSRDELEQSNRITEQFDELSGQRVNTAKSVSWALSAELQSELKGLTLAGAEVEA